MRRLLAGMMAGLVLLAGCAPGEKKPDPAPTAPTAPPRDLPPADPAVDALVTALNAQDVGTIPMVKAASEAQEEFTTVFAGMDGFYPTVAAAGITYGEDDTAVATLSMSYDLGLHGWKYESQARFNWVTDTWRLDWAPTVIHPKLTSDSRLRHTHKEPRRGAINDNEGLAIVEEGTLYEVGIDKSTIDAGQWAASASALAKALKIDEKAYLKKLEANGPKAFVIAGTLAQEDIPGSVADIDGTLVREITAVVGPSDGLAAPLLGAVGAPTKEMIDKSDGTLSAQDRVGVSGLQLRYDEFLRGVPQIKVDQVGRKSDGQADQAFEEQTLFEQQASVSTAIETSLDRALQAKAEKVLSKQKGLATLVVLDLKTGGVLAAAQSPSGGTFPYATYGKYAPGSTFKAVTALAMLRDGLTPTSTVKCPANLKVNTYTFGNYSGYPSSALGSIPLTDAFKYSCNTSFAGSDVDAEQLSDAAASLGVGTDYDAGFTSYFGTVAPGNAIDLAASKIGQGQVTMSPLGMAAVAASIGSGQTTIPWLVKDHEAKPKASLSESEATQLQTLMKATVDSGTGRPLRGLMTGAKTGTAQWGQKGKLETHAWMIAYNDDYAVSAFVEVGDSGGTTAAPLIVKLLG